MSPPSDLIARLVRRARERGAVAAIDSEEFEVACRLAAIGRILRQSCAGRGEGAGLLDILRAGPAGMASPKRLGRLVRLLSRPGALDPDFYRRAHPDLAEARVDPVAHHIRFGGSEGRAVRPDQAFDAEEDLREIMRSVDRLEDLAVDEDLTSAVRSWVDRPFRLDEPEPSGPTLLFLHSHTDRMTRRYRLDAWSDLLEIRGWNCRSTLWTQADKTALQADRLVLCRTPIDAEAAALLDERRRSGRPTVFDIDDLVTEGDTPLSRAFRRAMACATRITASTLSLAGCLGADAVLPNVIAETTWRGAEARRRDSPSDRFQVGYFSGSRTHDADFQEAAEGIWAAMRATPGIHLLLMGDLGAETPADLSSRITRRPRQPHSRMLQTLSETDVVLAPLAPSLFNDCKSELKIFEAALHGVPTIASPTASYAAAIRTGHDGMIAADTAAWRSSLITLARDRGLSRRLGRRAREGIAPRFRAAENLDVVSRAWSLE